MTGASTVLWKELRELLGGGGRPTVQLIVGGAFNVLLGIAMPIILLSVAGGFLDGDTTGRLLLVIGGATIGICAFMGLMGPLATVADAFAGERERHTLETLLATPIPDGAILWGKMLAQYMVVLAHVALISVAAGVTSGILLGPLGFLVLPAGLLLGGLAALVAASFVIGLGTFMSLRSPTVKKAQERLGYVMLPVFLLPGLLPSLFTGVLGRLDPRVLVALSFAGPALVIALSVTFNALAFARFRRNRLLAPR